MKKRSNKFTPGERRAGTMLTIIDSVKPDSWDQILCRCDCGTEFVANYMEVYRGKYSCGCQRRLRIDTVNLEGLTAYNPAGNHKYGRALTVLGRDYATQQWQYICSCCGELFLMHRGDDHGAQRVLKNVAGGVCANFRRYYPAEYLERLTNAILTETGYRVRGSAGRYEQAVELSAYYDRRHLKYNRLGKLEGFWGFPDKPLPRSWRVTRADAFVPRVESTTISDADDADNFGAIPELLTACEPPVHDDEKDSYKNDPQYAD